MLNTRTSRALHGFAAVLTATLAIAAMTGVATQSAQAATPDDLMSCTQRVRGPSTGALTVGAGEKLCLRNADVTGAINVLPGGAFTSRNSTIVGAITLNGARSFSFCHSTTTDAISAVGTTGPVQVGGARLHVPRKCRGNDIAGAVALQGNTSVTTLARNHISGAVAVDGNEAASGAATKIAYNKIVGSLSCSENAPAPTNTGHPNTVGGARSGQCAATDF